MPRWHEAGKIKISNPAEVRAKLIPRFKMDNILKYYGTSWVNALMCEGYEGCFCNFSYRMYNNINNKTKTK